MDTLEQKLTTKNDLRVDCISRTDALCVALNEYLRGWHHALHEALSEKYSIHCEEGNFSVIQEETITRLGLSMNCALGKDVVSYMNTMPSVTPQPKIGHWTDDGYCSCCGAESYPYDLSGYESIYHSYCPNCGSKNK